MISMTERSLKEEEKRNYFTKDLESSKYPSDQSVCAGVMIV